MFEVTFVGHQGWLVRTATSTVLVDPLLTDRFGHGGHLGAIYPPRRIDLEGFPNIDAVIVSHEHDDHFDIPSLHRLDRTIPIYMSAHSSSAAHNFVQQLGFQLHLLRPGVTTVLGDLRLRCFAADHRSTPQSDEWDVLPFALWDTHGHGSMVSSIDVRMPAEMMRQLRECTGTPGVWCHANNSTHTGFVEHRQPTTWDDDMPRLAAVVHRRYLELTKSWGTPAATLICGGGWSFEGDRQWINHHAFAFDSARLCEHLRKREPNAVFTAPVPGESVVMRNGQLAQRSPSQPFLKAAPRSSWPDRRHDPKTTRSRNDSPATGSRRLSTTQQSELGTALSDYARFMCTRPLFRALHSLPPTVEGPRAAWGFFVLDDEANLFLRHDPTACGFVGEHTDDPQRSFVSGIECWGTDLLALLNGELAPSAMCYSGRMRVWNHCADLRVTPHDLWIYGHPLRRPEAALALYRALLEGEPSDPPRVPGPRS